MLRLLGRLCGQGAPAHARSSHMMRLLGADSGARQSVLEMMDLGSLARLHSTGRSWRGWITAAPSIGARTIDITGDQERDPSRCQWLRRSVQHLLYQDSVAPAISFDQLLLPQWSRLRSIKATFHGSLPSAELLRSSFASVAATLQCLAIHLWGRSLPTAANLLSAICSLQQLESLSIIAAGELAHLDLNSVDVSPLLALPRLQQFALRLMVTRPCSPAQVIALAQCKSLTALECGQWLPLRSSVRQHAVQLTAAQLQQLEDSLGLLMRLRGDNGAEPLRRLHLGAIPTIFPQCWRVLSQFNALEVIDASWSRTVTAADWMLLATFPRLHSLCIRGLEYEDGHALLDLGLVLPSLERCYALRSLGLHDSFDLRTEHAALLAQIPSLEAFKGEFLRIESLEPLSNAPALTELSFEWCVGLNDERINLRAMIPPMPLVNKLRISDPWLSLMTAKQAEPFNVALLARLPKLTPGRFKQW